MRAACAKSGHEDPVLSEHFVPENFTWILQRCCNSLDTSGSQDCTSSRNSEVSLFVGSPGAKTAGSTNLIAEEYMEIGHTFSMRIVVVTAMLISCERHSLATARSWNCAVY